MPALVEVVSLAIGLIFDGDRNLYEIVALSLRVSCSAVLIGAALGLPLGALLAIRRFPGRGGVITVINALMGLPPVVVGLFVYLLFSNVGPLGWLRLLYSPAAMIVAQTLLVAPILCALSRQTLADLNREYDEPLRALGVSGWRRVATLLYEGRHALITVGLAAFGRAIAEVGAVIIVGGNINHVTRVMTTAIALETSRGDLALALALGLVLLLIALAVNAGAGLLGRSLRVSGDD
ncbi:MAG: ABC transporter permease [Gammaproteobacteria bacterium]|nr:ABC transporter permease [Gammaproteobacteria bacterium]